MAWTILQFVLAALVIVAAGTALTRYGDAIADLTGLGRVVVGSIFLAGATSLPELLVDLNAVRLGFPDLAVGDLVGSSLFNLLILAVLDMSHYSRGQLLSRVSAAHALSATLSIALTVLAALAILLGARLGGFVVGGVGVGCLALLVAYLFGVRVLFYDQRTAAQAAQQASARGQTVMVPAGKVTLRRAIIGYVISAGVIVAAAPFLAGAAGEIADASGLGATFIGTTLVAFCTSLPELVATLVAVRMGALELAVGNIFGSNAFNMVLLVPLDLAHPGSLLAAVSPNHALTCLATILVTAVAVMGQLYQVEKRIHVLEPDAVLIILLILGSLVMLYYLR
jgi:cation:H+ antiporter